MSQPEPFWWVDRNSVDILVGITAGLAAILGLWRFRHPRQLPNALGGDTFGALCDMVNRRRTIWLLAAPSIAVLARLWRQAEVSVKVGDFSSSHYWRLSLFGSIAILAILVAGILAATYLGRRQFERYRFQKSGAEKLRARLATGGVPPNEFERLIGPPPPGFAQQYLDEITMIVDDYEDGFGRRFTAGEPLERLKYFLEEHDRVLGIAAAGHESRA